MKSSEIKNIDKISSKQIYVLMLFAALFWSGAFVAGKYSVPFIPPFTLTFLRFIFATLILYGVIQYSKSKGRYEYKVVKKDIPLFLFTGVIGMMGYHMLFFSALQFTTAINSSIIAATNPMITVILSFFLLKQRAKAIQIFGILISFVGVILTITGADLGIVKELSFNRGDLLMLLAVTSWAIYSVVSKSKGGHLPPMALTFYSFLVCTILIIPFALWEKPWEFLPQVPVEALAAVLYMSIFASVIGYLVQQISIREIGPGKTNIFINLVPFFSMVLSTAILGEELQLIKVFTAILIVAGVYICQKN